MTSMVSAKPYLPLAMSASNAPNVAESSPTEAGSAFGQPLVGNRSCAPAPEMQIKTAERPAAHRSSAERRAWVRFNFIKPPICIHCMWRISIIYGREPQQRIKLAKHFAEIAKKARARRGGGTQFSPDDPGLDLLPVFARRPAGMFGPFPFFRAVPITFVAAAQALFLGREPARTLFQMGSGNLPQRRSPPLHAGMQAEAPAHPLPPTPPSRPPRLPL